MRYVMDTIEILPCCFAWIASVRHDEDQAQCVYVDINGAMIMGQY